MPKIKHPKYSQQHFLVNFCKYALLTKMKHDKQLTNKVLLMRKFPDLHTVYMCS